MARKLTWWEADALRPGPFAPWDCPCCGHSSTFAEYASERHERQCAKCAELFCDLNAACVAA